MTTVRHAEPSNVGSRSSGGADAGDEWRGLALTEFADANCGPRHRRVHVSRGHAPCRDRLVEDEEDSHMSRRVYRAGAGDETDVHQIARRTRGEPGRFNTRECGAL